jgi:hypothetical protein
MSVEMATRFLLLAPLAVLFFAALFGDEPSSKTDCRQVEDDQ